MKTATLYGRSHGGTGFEQNLSGNVQWAGQSEEEFNNDQMIAAQLQEDEMMQANSQVAQAQANAMYYDENGQAYYAGASLPPQRFSTQGTPGQPSFLVSAQNRILRVGSPPALAKYYNKEFSFKQWGCCGSSNEKVVTVLVVLLTVIDVGLFALAVAQNGGFEPFDVNPFIGPSNVTLDGMYARNSWKISNVVTDDVDIGCVRDNACEQGVGPCPDCNLEWYRLLVPIFLHVGLIHLVLNILIRWQLLIIMEPLWGQGRLLFIYLVSGLGGNLLSSVYSTVRISVGASGSLFGLIASLMLFLFQFSKAFSFPGLVSIFIFVFLVADAIVTPILVGDTDIYDSYAHTGGAVSGFLATLVVWGHSPSPENWQKKIGSQSPRVMMSLRMYFF